MSYANGGQQFVQPSQRRSEPGSSDEPYELGKCGNTTQLQSRVGEIASARLLLLRTRVRAEAERTGHGSVLEAQRKVATPDG